MTYQNRQSSFMLVSTAAIKRGSMKIDPPDSERTRSQAVRSTAPIELKTRFVYCMRRRYPEEAQRQQAASPRFSATVVVRPMYAVMAVECLASGSGYLPIARIDRGILARRESPSGR